MNKINSFRDFPTLGTGTPKPDNVVHFTHVGKMDCVQIVTTSSTGLLT